jgi:GAF domain-containing protein
MARPAGPSERAGFSAPDGEAALRLQQLARVTSELGAAETMDDVVESAVNHIAGAVGAAVSSLLLRNGDELEMVAGYNLRPGVSEAWNRSSIDDPNPAAEAARTGRPVLMDATPGWEERYPSLRGQVPAGRSIVALPLSSAESVGVLALTFDGNWLPGPRELDFLTTFAEACGQAVRRVRSTTVARDRAQQLAFLAEASAELARSLDYRVTLGNVARLVVPGLADWCAVDVYENGRLTTLAVAHVDPDKVAWAWELQRRYPPHVDTERGAARVAQTGESQLVVEITDEMLVEGARDEEHLRLSRELNLRSAIVVPLAARERALGAITLIRSDNPQPYGPADLAVAEDLGRRAGIAVENALLHEQARDTAIQLQRAVLPERLADIAGWEVAAHYEAGGTAEVGGDFYDAVALPEGRLAACIGDVMGHGIPAAAAMAQIRASIRALVTVDPAPEVVLGNLQRMFVQFGLTRLVTLVYALIDPGDGRISVINAGHFAPMLVDADGEARWLTAPPRRLLGAEPDLCVETSYPFAAGDTLVMFTDGLVERRTETIDSGLDRALGEARRLASADLTAALAAFVAQVRGVDGDDDVTALAVRPRRPDPG